MHVQKTNVECKAESHYLQRGYFLVQYFIITILSVYSIRWAMHVVTEHSDQNVHRPLAIGLPVSMNL